MKRAVTKALVLLAVFFGSLTLFIQMFSQEVTVGTANMGTSPSGLLYGSFRKYG